MKKHLLRSSGRIPLGVSLLCIYAEREHIELVLIN